MSTSFTLALLWLVAANVIGMFPSKDHHWRNAYMLIAAGIPILIWVFWENGIWLALIFVVAAASILRWPVIYLMRWVRGLMGKADK